MDSDVRTSTGDFAVRLSGAGKRYVKYEDVPTLVGWAKRFGARKRRGTLWAVRHLELDVAPGETVGIIGRNGSGKTTTLRMLAGVTAPTEGFVAVRGRVAPLISVGVGFHQELTGRENVYVNGTVLGMTRREIHRLFDDIVGFAELQEFIDTPVKFYSSGMLVRLGFAVAVAARPDVLLVDEVLAVGDLAFQMKCHRRMAEIREAGTSVVVVSHNLTAVRHLCSRILVLDAGVPVFLGSTPDAIAAYYGILEEGRGEGGESQESAPVRILDSTLLGASGKATAHLTAGEKAVLHVEAEFVRAVENPVFGVIVNSETGLPLYADSTFVSGTRRFEAGERARWDVRFRMRLPTGTYSARATVRWGPGDAVRHGRLLLFYVAGRPFVMGLADLEASFDVSDGSPRRRPRARGSGAKGGLRPDRRSK